MTNEILILLLAFQVKHLIADYYLQFPYMYENKGKAVGWFMPLFTHSGFHGIGTLLIVGVHGSFMNPDATSYHISLVLLGAMVFDFITHFITDRWKATRKGGPDTTSFWQYLGIDQMVHHLVGILIVWWIV